MRTLLTGLVCLGASLFGADLLPLQTGNTWLYRESKTGQTLTVTVGTPLINSGRVFYPLSGYAAQKVFVRLNEQGELVYLDEERDQEFLLTSFTPVNRAWWNAPFRICEQEGQAQPARAVFDGAAGPIQGVLDIRYRSFGCADAGVEQEQFAENIGMVRRVVTSFAGPQQFDLVYARVGRQVIDALPNGRFTINASWAKDSPTINVTLRLQLNSSSSLKLLFATAQEYDLVLRDEEGKVVWRWSDGQFFGQSMHVREFGTEWTANLRLPRPSQGSYTLQAWLTTAGDAPQFAATVPITIAPAH